MLIHHSVRLEDTYAWPKQKKKRKIFFSIFRKNKGGAPWKHLKFWLFCPDRNFWPINRPIDLKIGRINILCLFDFLYKGIWIWSNRKNFRMIWSWKILNCEKRPCPPLWNECPHNAEFYLACNPKVQTKKTWLI